MENKSYDVIIVGGGMGGLIAGAALSKEGLRVILLEKLDAVGGRLKFTRHGDFMISTGPHSFGTAFGREGLDKVMERCGVKATLYQCGPIQLYNLRKHKVYDLTGSPEEITAKYRECIGLTQEEMVAICKAWESTRDPKTYQGKTVSQWVEGLETSPRVKKIMNKLWFWHVDAAISDPDKVSMETYAISTRGH